MKFDGETLIEWTWNLDDSFEKSKVKRTEMNFGQT